MNLLTFNKGKQLSNLSTNIFSDHAAIGICFDNVKILSNNISNPEYHKYFAKGPFANTHMNTNKNDANESKRKWLEEKTVKQIKEFVDNVKNEKWDIQIIVEAYVDLLNSISQKISNYTHKIVSILNVEPERYQNENKHKNITAMIINESKLELLSFSIKKINYIEINSTSTSTLILPICYLKNKETKKLLVVVGVHIPGNSEQFPVVALTEFKKVLNEIQANYNIIAMGDFNTVPANLESIFSGSKLKVLNPLYPTHINPNCDIAVYDNIVYNTQDEIINQYPLDCMDNSSKEYVNSLLSTYV